MDLISIVIPIYNVENFLSRCLDSIVNQSYPNIEVILVNDGSTDKSEKICEKYTEKYDFVKYYKKSNGGLSDARNYGVKKSSGDYIGFVDSDDWISLNMYQVLHDDIVRYNADISCVGFEMVSEFHGNEYTTPGQSEIMSDENAIIHLFSNEKYANFAWNKLYRKDLFDGVDYPFGRMMEDLGTTYKLFLKASKIIYNPSKQYKYFQRSDSILHNIKKGFYEDKLELSQERYLAINEIYPNIMENTVFYLNTIFECLPYVDVNSELFKKSISTYRGLDKKYLKELSNKRKLCATVLSFNPHLFKCLFGKSYD